MSVVVLILMVLLIFVGMPVGFALGVAGVVGLFFAGGWGAVSGILSTAPYRTAASYTLTVVPMFILMAEFISRSKIVDDVFVAAHKWLERLPGGLAIATVFASAGMAAMAGSSTASAATMAKVAVPQLRKYGYNTPVAAGVVTVAGSLAIMIPPSITFVLYGIITETSIGKLLIAGIIPGSITAIVYCLGILVWKRVSPEVMPPPTRLFNWKERWGSLRPLWAFVLLVIAVIWSIYSGWATVTEAAAIGAFIALVLGLAMRRLKRDDINQSAVATVQTTTMIFTIIIGAMIFGYFLTVTQTTQNLLNFVATLDVPAWMIMGCVVILYLILGCIMDSVAIQFITLPLTFPLVTSLGYDPIWFGVITVKLIEIGLITPPIGMNAYVVSSSSNIPLEDVFRGTWVMLAMEFVTLFLLLSIPFLSTWLPSVMRG